MSRDRRAPRPLAGCKSTSASAASARSAPASTAAASTASELSTRCRRAELVGDVGSEDARLHGGGVGLQRAFHQPGVRARMLAEGDDALDLCILRAALEPRELRVVAVDHRSAAALEPEEDFGLGVRD